MDHSLELAFRQALPIISAFPIVLFPPSVSLGSQFLDAMKFALPVRLSLNGKNAVTWMGPFEHSTEREFLLHSQKRVLQECRDADKLRHVAIQLWESHIAQSTAMQSLMMENINLRQAMAVQESSLRAADELLTQAGEALQQYEKQSSGAKKGLWSWWR
jgi:hypothetical protein